MTKKLLVVLAALFAMQAYAQDGTTASPYSFYGIGSLKFKGTVENRSMGGISIYNDSIHVNLRNPASYATPNLRVWNGENRPVKFALGGSHTSIDLKSQDSKGKTSSTTFDYLAISLPLGRFGLGFGLIPYSSVGYEIEDSNTNGDVENRYKGNGGLNKAFVGLGYLISDNLSLGADVSYNFGKIENNVLEFLYNNGELVQYQTAEDNRSDLSGLDVNFGITYRAMISDRLELQSGATYALSNTLTSTNERSISTVIVNPETGEQFKTNTADVDLNPDGGTDLRKTDLTMPSRISFGAGVGEPRKWFVGADYTMRNTSEFSNPFVTIDNAAFIDANNLSVGGFYIPDYSSLSSYWKRVVYRAGFNFEKTGLRINNEDIKQFGMSFGIGIPVGGDGLSNANIGFEFGKRGTTNQNLVQENFFNVRIGLSLNDRWFEKRKYN